MEKMLIAMKGHPCTGKSTLALSMAHHLKCPLIDLDDIQNSLSNFILLSSHDYGNNISVDDTSFQSLCRIAMRNLLSNFDIIIDSPLSCRSHLDQLICLSASTQAHLVIIECKPQDKYEWKRWVEQRGTISSSSNILIGKPANWEDLLLELHVSSQSSDYDTNDVSKVVVNTSDVVYITDVVKVIKKIIKSNQTQCVYYHDWFAYSIPDLMEAGPDVNKKYTEKRMVRKKNIKMKNVKKSTIHKPHCHELAMISSPNQEEELDDNVVNCRACLKPVSRTAAAYKCRLCPMYLHISCAELPNKTEIMPRDYPDLLKEIKDRYPFQEENKVGGSNKCVTKHKETLDVGECTECLFESYLRSAGLPSILNHPCHEHPLGVMILPISLGFLFRCDACGEKGEHIGYYCHKCDFKCHLTCGLLTRTFKQLRHLHPLSLTFLPEYVNSDEEFLCDACETFRNPNHWLYHCARCEFACHISCMTFED